MLRLKYLSYLQIAGWSIAAVLFFFYLRERLNQYEIAYVAGITIISFLSFMLIIYGYIYIHRKFYKNLQKHKFVLLNIVFFAVVLLLRVVLEIYLVARLTNRQTIFTFSRQQIAYDIISLFIAFIVGVLLKGALDYLRIYKEQEALKLKQFQTEMQLLKAQVQPHFLFNSLNNIYYVAYKDSPRTAELIEKLSMIMRYFLNETQQERISLEEELKFIGNYIDMENLRLHNKVSVSIRKETNGDILIPPMLFIPLIENVFKHGIDKKNGGNFMQICILVKNGFLEFSVQNKISSYKQPTNGGFGLHNLEERLKLLYQHRFELRTEENDDQFSAFLKIPVS